MIAEKHLLGLEGYPAENIETIIETAFGFREILERPIKKVPSPAFITTASTNFVKWWRTPC
ncbi:aspartate carbamoyltransferase, partial [Candidatus Neomarinimicrobiota bacterium]